MSRDQFMFESDVMDIRDTALLDLCILNEYFNESSREDKRQSVLSKLVDMMSSLCKRIRKAITRLREKINKKLREEKFRREIKKIKNSNIDKDIEFIDVWKYDKYFKKEVRELSRLCDAWTDAYARNGASVTQANRFEKNYQNIIDIYEPELERLRKNKIKVSSQKVKKWLLDNTQENGDPAGMLLIYTEKLEKCEKSLKDAINKREKYIETTGYDNGPASFAKFMTNSSMYVHKNADWLSMFAVSALSLFSGWSLEKSDKKDIGKYYRPDHTEPSVQRQEKKQFENEVFEDPDHISKKKTASKIARRGAAVTASMGVYTKMKSTNRTSI